MINTVKETNLISYEVVWDKDSMRKATIEFANNKFCQCKFQVLNSIHDLDDWQFLNELSQYILDTQKGLNL